MNAKDKRRFIRELTRTVERGLLADVAKMPEDWDGVELRWLMAERFGQAVFHGDATSLRRRKAAFNNNVLVLNL